MIVTNHSDAYSWWEPTMERVPTMIAVGGISVPVQTRNQLEQWRGADLRPLQLEAYRIGRADK